MSSRNAPRMISGIPGSSGIAIASALILRESAIALSRDTIAPEAVGLEIECFREARARASAQLQRLIEGLPGEGKAERRAILDGHLVLLEDEELEQDVLALIRDGHMRADRAINQAVERYAQMMAALDDPYLRERAADCRDVGRRLLRALGGGEAVDIAAIDREVVLVARDLSPSETAQIDPRFVKGFVTESGGRTSHSAIIARALELPAVLGASGASETIRDGDLVAIDAGRNEVWINPDAERLVALRVAMARDLRERTELAALRDLPALTRDGHTLALHANIGAPREAGPALVAGAEGVGLLRSEFLFMDRNELPDEEEQYAAYRAVAEAMAGRPVTVRTMDIGGDKELSYLAFPRELNPFLGWRAVRIFRDRPEIMRPQLRAILRASVHGKLRLMFPMISAVEELRALRVELESLKDELRAANIPFDPALEVGIMIETPAAALLAVPLAREVDFFSIGTNDLTQYVLAVDRCNEAIAALYQPLSPAVLMLIGQVTAAAHAAGKWVGLCGELAAEERVVPLLVGLGLDELSMSPAAIPRIKRAVRAVTTAKARRLAEAAVASATVAEVEALLDDFATLPSPQGAVDGVCTPITKE